MDDLLDIEPDFANEIILNSHIESEHDLQTLQLLFELKQRYVRQGKQVQNNIAIDSILTLRPVHSEDVIKFKRILTIALQLQSNNDQLIHFLDWIYQNMFSLNEDTLNTLKLMRFAMDYCRENNQLDCFKEFARNNSFIEPIQLIVKSDRGDLIKFVCINIVPIYFYINGPEANEILYTVWSVVKRDENLNLLCLLTDYYFPLETTTHSMYLIHIGEFWEMIQRLLVTSMDGYQKSIVFLLRKIIASLYHKRHVHLETNLIEWTSANKSEMLMAWEHLFTILELLNAQQLHLIEPIYTLLPAIDHLLHPFWIWIVYKNLLNHTHSTVVNYALCTVMGKVEWCEDNDYFDQVIASVLNALNRNDADEESVLKSTWTQFYTFGKNMSERRFKNMLEISLDMKWTPTNHYYFANVLLKRNESSAWYECDHLKLLEHFTKNVINIPNSFIRDGCKGLLYNFVKNMKFEQHISFDNYVRIAYPLCDSFTNINLDVYKSEMRETISKCCASDDEIDRRKIQFINKLFARCCISNMKDELVDENFFQKGTNTNFNITLGYHLYTKTHNGRYRHLFTDFFKQKLATLTDKSGFLEFRSILTNPIRNAFPEHLTREKRLLLFEFCKSIITNRTSYNKYQIEVAYLLFFNQSDALLNQLGIEDIDYCWQTDMDYFEPKFFQNMLLSFLYGRYINQLIDKLLALKGTANYAFSMAAFIHFLRVNKFYTTLCDLFEKINDSEKCLKAFANELKYLPKLEPALANNFIRMALQMLLMGDVLGKSERHEYSVCCSIKKASHNCAHSNYEVKHQIRFHVFKYLKAMVSKGDIQERYHMADSVAVALIHRYEIHMGKRYYKNSQILLLKLRIIQAIAIIHEHLDAEREPMINFLIDCICNESHQVSIKFLIQSILIQLLRKDTNWMEPIRMRMESTSKSKPSTIVAFIPIVYHLTLAGNRTTCYDAALKLMIPWTMGAHFNLRLHAQKGVLHLLQNAPETIRNQYEVMRESIENILKQSRKIDALDDYFLTSFDPATIARLSVICYVIPKITNDVPIDEYDQFKYWYENDKPTQDEFDNDVKRLLQIEPCPIQIPCNHTTTTFIQKKQTPAMDFDAESSSQSKATQLIVIASLIDKAPNLGGLNRTCEIFSVRTLALNSLATANHSEFKGVSMSSENWVTIKEVRKDDLAQYLRELAEDGYTVVGLEQTQKSISVNDYKFPQRSALLLGNEKEGITPNLLPLLDTCIVIPQFGVIRSLNVHVAGALCIWEYVKQHLC